MNKRKLPRRLSAGLIADDFRQAGSHGKAWQSPAPAGNGLVGRENIADPRDPLRDLDPVNIDPSVIDIVPESRIGIRPADRSVPHDPDGIQLDMRRDARKGMN